MDTKSLHSQYTFGSPKIVHQHKQEGGDSNKLFTASVAPYDPTLYERTSRTFKAAQEASRRLGMACTEYLKDYYQTIHKKQTKTEK